MLHIITASFIFIALKSRCFPIYSRPQPSARSCGPLAYTYTMNNSRLQQVADYGGVLNTLLCVLHCAAGPLLLLWWGAHEPSDAAEYWELGFLGLSGVFVVLATWKRSTPRLRFLLWGLFVVFALSGLLTERWPFLEIVQYVASAGLIGAHLLNQRYGRCCEVDSIVCASCISDAPRNAQAN